MIRILSSFPGMVVLTTYGVLATCCSTLIFIVMIFCPLYVAYLFVRRFHPGLKFCERWAAAGIVAVCLAVIIFNITAYIHFFNRYLVAGICLFFAFFGHLFWRKHANFLSEKATIKSWQEEMMRSRWCILFFMICGSLLVSLLRSLTLPPLSWDSMLYHLYFAGTWVQNKGGGLLFEPDVIKCVASFPHNGEIIAAWLMLPFHGDLMVNTMNFFFIGIGGLSIYALGKELNLSKSFSSLLTCSLCFSPMLYSYITTQYVDILVFTALINAILFFFRFLRTQKRIDVFFMYIALALAVGTKYSALPLTMLLCFLSSLSVLSGNIALTRKIRRTISFIGVGLLVLIIVGGSQYFINWKETRNPFYPNKVSMGKHIIFPGSLYWENVAKDKEVTSLRDDFFSIIKLSIYPPDDLPRSAGLNFIFFGIIAFFSIFRPAGNSKKIIWFLTLLWLLPVILMYTSNSANIILIRRFLPFDAARFLSVSFALMAIVAILRLAIIKKKLIVKVFLALFIVWDLHRINYQLPFSYKQLYFFPVILTLLAIFLWLVFKFSRIIIRLTARCNVFMLFMSGLVAVTLFVSVLQKYRDITRVNSLSKCADLHDFPREFIKGWGWCDNPAQSQIIAFTTDFRSWDDRWFLYPLMGRRLQNKVIHVAADSEGFGTFAERRNYLAWKENLKSSKVDLIFIQKPWPIELEWVSQNPQLFKLEQQGEAFCVYRVISQKSAANMAWVN
ncbi:MAG: hypothetical protein WCI77_00765 [Candidatus Omnitrophota bacterium]